MRAYPKAMLLKPDSYWPNPPYGPKGGKPVVESGSNSNSNNPTTGDGEDIDGGGEEMIPPAVTKSSDRLNMSLLCIAGKKALHKKAVIRKIIQRKFKVALGLIVVRGAETDVSSQEEEKGREMGLRFKDDASEERKWVLQGIVLLFLQLGFKRLTGEMG
jgi:hypothetical protein